MRVLIGTTNPAKVRWFAGMIARPDVELVTLKDLHIDSEPRESGVTPEENARIKAEYYGQFCDYVICGDAGLYFAGMDLRDPRQPGLKIRSPQGVRLGDEEMIAYYSALVHTLGGRVTAHYLNGAAVWNRGRVTSWLEDERDADSFYMVDVPSKERREGWPLDSLSIRKNSSRYFLEEEPCAEKENAADINHRLPAFLIHALGLEKEA